MNKENDNDVEVTISHASFCTALLENKSTSIKLSLGKKEFKCIFERPKEDAQNRMRVQLAIIDLDSTLVSSVTDLLNPCNIDQKTNVDKLLQSLDKIEFKPLDSLLQIESDVKDFPSEELRVENEKATKKSKSHYDNQMTVINSNIENQRCFRHLSLSSDNPEIYNTDVSILRRQSLQPFGRKRSSVLQRSHSWICTSLATNCKY